MSDTQTPGALFVPFPDGPLVDPKTGRLTMQWRRFFINLLTRTGGAQGMDISAIADRLATALATASAAQQAATAAMSEAQAATTQAKSASASANDTALSAAMDRASAAGSLVLAEEVLASAQLSLSQTQDMVLQSLLTSAALSARAAQPLDGMICAIMTQKWP